MPIDKLMATQATLATVYGMQIGAQPEKAGEMYVRRGRDRAGRQRSLGGTRRGVRRGARCALLRADLKFQS